MKELDEICNEKKIKKRKVELTSFSFIFLSLTLSVLCFFIYLVQSSNFEKIKIDALRTSLQSSFSNPLTSFSQLNSSFEANQLVIYHQGQIAKMFPSSKISQDLIKDEISVLIPTNYIFKPTTSEFKPTETIFFNQLKSLLNARFVKNKYDLELLLFQDLTDSQNYPVFNHLTTERLQQITDKMKRIGILDTNYMVGVEKGNSDFLKLHFRKHHKL